MSERIKYRGEQLVIIRSPPNTPHKLWCPPPKPGHYLHTRRDRRARAEAAPHVESETGVPGISAARVADGPRLAEAWGSPRRALALRRESRLRSTSSDRSPVPSSFRPRLGLRPEGEVGPEFMAVALAEYMAAQNRQ